VGASTHKTTQGKVPEGKKVHAVAVCKTAHSSSQVQDRHKEHAEQTRGKLECRGCPANGTCSNEWALAMVSATVIARFRQNDTWSRPSCYLSCRHFVAVRDVLRLVSTPRGREGRV
jgi:hypothetical protein